MWTMRGLRRSVADGALPLRRRSVDGAGRLLARRRANRAADNAHSAQTAVTSEQRPLPRWRARLTAPPLHGRAPLSAERLAMRVSTMHTGPFRPTFVPRVEQHHGDESGPGQRVLRYSRDEVRALLDRALNRSR